MERDEPKRILLAAPRGFCAGVERAIAAVEDALRVYGAPVYVRHEIVHNVQVVDRLRGLGAVFVEELDDAPDDRPVVFSAHGVPRTVPLAAKRRGLTFVDATCPLVSKVHAEARRYARDGYRVALVGHAGHPEVIGTLGQVPDGSVDLIEDEDDARRFSPPDPDRVAYVTQTTLSVDDAAAVVAVLKARFPRLRGPAVADICYATSNRQAAAKAIAADADLMLVLGSATSSNSRRLVEAARAAGCPLALLVEDPEAPPLEAIAAAPVIGVTAGASTPEASVEILLASLRAEFGPIAVREVEAAREDVAFRPPVVREPTG